MKRHPAWDAIWALLVVQLVWIIPFLYFYLGNKFF